MTIYDRSQSEHKNVHRNLIGYTAIGQWRTYDGRWHMYYAWALTRKGALRRLDRMRAESMWSSS